MATVAAPASTPKLEQVKHDNWHYVNKVMPNFKEDKILTIVLKCLALIVSLPGAFLVDLCRRVFCFKASIEKKEDTTLETESDGLTEVVDAAEEEAEIDNDPLVVQSKNFQEKAHDAALKAKTFVMANKLAIGFGCGVMVLNPFLPNLAAGVTTFFGVKGILHV